MRNWRSGGRLCGWNSPGTCHTRPQGFPPWLHVYARDVGVSRLDSAGLAMALDGRLDKDAWPLPAGVGFTGRLKNLGARNPTLAGVTGLSAKLQAAREAGFSSCSPAALRTRRLCLRTRSSRPVSSW